LGPRAGLDVVAKKQFLPFQGLYLGHPARSLVHWSPKWGSRILASVCDVPWGAGRK